MGAEEITDISQHVGLIDAIKKYYETVDKAKMPYENSLQKAREAARKSGNVAVFNALEAEIEHTAGKNGHGVSRYTPTDKASLNRKVALKRVVDDARNDFKKSAGRIASEFLRNGKTDLARETEALAKLEEPPRHYIDTEAGIQVPDAADAIAAGNENEIATKVVNIKKYLPHVPKGKTLKSISPGGSGTIGMNWAFCVSKTPDDRILVLSRFADEKWLLPYDVASDRFGNVFEPPNDDREVTFHVIPPKSPGKCLVGFRSGLVCEYDIKTGKIVRRISGKGRIDEMVLNKNGDKLYFGGHPTVWDLKTNEVTEIESGDGNALALSNDGTRLAAGFQDRDAVTIYDTDSLKPVASIKTLSKITTSVQFTRNGKGVLIGTENPATLSLHAVSTGKPIFSIGGFEEGKVSNAFFNENESLLFVVCSKYGWCDPPVLVFDVKTLLPVCQFQLGEMCGAKNAVLSADERRLIPGTCRSVRVCEIPDRPTIFQVIGVLRAIP